MQHESRVAICLMLTGALVLGGCASHPPRPKAAAQSAAQVPQGAQSSGAANEGAAAGAAINGGEPGSGPAVAGPSDSALLKMRKVYFDFDSSLIKPQFDDLIAAHARYLIAHPNIHVRLEGNCDPRGSREYNIGLGERRAQAVAQALMLQGVSNDQITTVSYGAERPAVTGRTEAAYALDRRVNIAYLN